MHACAALARGAVFVSRGAPGQHKRGGHPLQVPLERTANGFVEVVDVEDQPSVGSGIRAQVAHVRVAAKLATRCPSTAAAPGRRPSPAPRRESSRRATRAISWYLSSISAARGRAWIARSAPAPGTARLGVESPCSAAHLLAPRLAKAAAFFRSCPVHTAEHTPSPVPRRNTAEPRVIYTFRWKPRPLSHHLLEPMTGSPLPGGILL